MAAVEEMLPAASSPLAVLAAAPATAMAAEKSTEASRDKPERDKPKDKAKEKAKEKAHSKDKDKPQDTRLAKTAKPATVTAKASAAAAPATAKAAAGAAAPGGDADVDLIAALMQHMSRDTAGGKGELTIADLVARCKALPGSESQRCMRRICENYWGRAEACPRTAAPNEVAARP